MPGLTELWLVGGAVGVVATGGERGGEAAAASGGGGVSAAGVGSDVRGVVVGPADSTVWATSTVAAAAGPADGCLSMLFTVFSATSSWASTTAETGFKPGVTGGGDFVVEDRDAAVTDLFVSGLRTPQPQSALVLALSLTFASAAALAGIRSQ